VSEIKISVAMHGPSNMLNFDNAMWEKYRLGEWLKVDDPKTGKPAIRNVYLPKTAGPSTTPNDKNSLLQDTSIEALQGRGVQFLSCHTATEEQAHGLISQFSLKASAEEIVQDLQAHILPGVLIVPAMVAAISLLQSQGHFTYITV
jgi:intracellular sulfur oxidation DsrE/DsrF family protein